jgi:hypothetical protein
MVVQKFPAYRCQSDCTFSGADGSIGQIPQNHFYALEVLRNTGTEAQKKRLYQKSYKVLALVMHLLNLKLKLQHINKLH